MRHTGLTKTFKSIRIIFSHLAHFSDALLSEEVMFFPLTLSLYPNSCLCWCCCFSKVESHPPQTKQLFYINPVAASRLTNATAKVRFFQNHCLPFYRWMHPIASCSHAVAVFKRFVPAATVAKLRIHGSADDRLGLSEIIEEQDFVNVLFVTIKCICFFLTNILFCLLVGCIYKYTIENDISQQFSQFLIFFS